MSRPFQIEYAKYIVKTLHRFQMKLFMGCPNARPVHPRWRTTAILKKKP